MSGDDEGHVDAYSRLYDPLRGIRERWMSRLNWWQKTLVLVGLFVVVMVAALVVTLVRSG